MTQMFIKIAAVLIFCVAGQTKENTSTLDVEKIVCFDFHFDYPVTYLKRYLTRFLRKIGFFQFSKNLRPITTKKWKLSIDAIVSLRRLHETLFIELSVETRNQSYVILS